MRSLVLMLSAAAVLCGCAQPAVIGVLKDCPEQEATARLFQPGSPYYMFEAPNEPFFAFNAVGEPYAARFGPQTPPCAQTDHSPPVPRVYDLRRVGDNAQLGCPASRG